MLITLILKNAVARQDIEERREKNKSAAGVPGEIPI